MRVEVMDRQAFEDALDRFGGDFGRWPPDLRGEAERLLASSPEARALKAEMDAVEACLRPTAMSSTPAMPFNGFAAVAMRRPQVRSAQRVARRAAWGAATAAALLLGVAIGNLQFEGQPESPDQVVARALDVPGSVDVD